MTRGQRRRSSGLACRERHPKPNSEAGSDQNSSGIRAKLSHARVGSHPVELAGVEERDADRVLVLFHTLRVGARAKRQGVPAKGLRDRATTGTPSRTPTRLSCSPSPTPRPAPPATRSVGANLRL